MKLFFLAAVLFVLSLPTCCYADEPGPILPIDVARQVFPLPFLSLSLFFSFTPIHQPEIFSNHHEKTARYNLRHKKTKPHLRRQKNAGQGRIRVPVETRWILDSQDQGNLSNQLFEWCGHLCHQWGTVTFFSSWLSAPPPQTPSPIPKLTYICIGKKKKNPSPFPPTPTPAKSSKT